MPLPVEEPYAVLLCRDGTRIEFDYESYEEVRKTLVVIQGGKGFTDNSDPWLTTGEVARLLDYSRRTVTRLLDAGEIPYERHGKGHRRVRYSDVLRYQDELPARRHEALEEMRRLYYESGMDDLDLIENYLEQFK